MQNLNESPPWRGRVRFEGGGRSALFDAASGRILLGGETSELYGANFVLEQFSVSVALDQVDVLCPVDVKRRPQVVCVGRNYAAHAKELGNEVPSVPKLFLKPYTTLCGPDDVIVRPVHMSDEVHYEGEIALVVGKELRDVRLETALDHIAGWTLANDVTARDVQKSDAAFSRGKGFETFCPLGPWVVPLPPSSLGGLKVETWVNGKRRQHGVVADMVFSMPELVVFISQIFPLQPGDVILTGTPEGVGPLSDGDWVEVRSQEGMCLRSEVKDGTAFPPWRA